MHLDGSCHCGAVTFSLESETPYPYMRCYCSICRKTGGGGGFAVNIMGGADTLGVEGADNMAVYRVKKEDGHPGDAHRHFCKLCGSALYVSDPRWPDLLHPFASAIDTALPTPPEVVHIMLDFAVPWAEVPDGPKDRHFAEYPDESIEDWHKRHGLDGG